MNIKRAKKLQFQDSKGNICYGGNQDWYSSNTHALAGCGSVSAANLVRMLAQTNGPFRRAVITSKKLPSEIKSAIVSPNCSRDNYELLMTSVYKTMGTMEVFPLNRIYDSKERGFKFPLHLPATFGITSTGFIIGIIRFIRKIGFDISVKSLNAAFLDKDSARDFIERGLSRSGAVSLLTCYNKHSMFMYPAKCDLEKPLTKVPGSYEAVNKSHFVTITDIDGDRLLVTSWGKPGVIDFNELVKSWHSIKAFESILMYIEPSTREASNKNLFTSVIPYIKGIIQTIIRRAI